MPGPARRLGPEHGRIGVSQQMLRLFAVRPPDGDPDAHAGEDFAPGQVVGFADLPLDSQGRRFGVGRPLDVLQNDGEFIPSQARDRVPEADAFHQPSGHGNEHPVALEMPEAVVDVLESIHVDAQNPEHVVFLPPDPGEGNAQTVHEERPVGKVGQRIVEGVEQKLFLQGFVIGDVDPVTGHFSAAAVDFRSNPHFVADPAETPVLVLHPDVMNEVPHIEKALEHGLDFLAILRMDDLDPAPGILQKFPGFVSQQGFRAAAHERHRVTVPGTAGKDDAGTRGQKMVEPRPGLGRFLLRPEGPAPGFVQLVRNAGRRGFSLFHLGLRGIRLH